MKISPLLGICISDKVLYYLFEEQWKSIKASFEVRVFDGRLSMEEHFGKRKIHPTFDPNVTNHMRHKRMIDDALAKKRENKSILEGAKILLTKVLGE